MNALDHARDELVRRWGEMGGYWGINRTMAEIHALMFVTDKPLCTDDVMARLQVSRGNASMNLRALVDWGLIQRVHVLGDRKEYFKADTDVWRMFETIMRERRRREVEPIIATIDRCREMVAPPAASRRSATPSARTDSDTHPPTDARNLDTDPIDPAEIREFRRRLDEFRDFLTTMGALFELVLKFGNKGIGRLTRMMMKGAIPTRSPARRK